FRVTFAGSFHVIGQRRRFRNGSPSASNASGCMLAVPATSARAAKICQGILDSLGVPIDNGQEYARCCIGRVTSLFPIAYDRRWQAESQSKFGLRHLESSPNLANVNRPNWSEASSGLVALRPFRNLLHTREDSLARSGFLPHLFLLYMLRS